MGRLRLLDGVPPMGYGLLAIGRRSAYGVLAMGDEAIGRLRLLDMGDWLLAMGR